jgi:hypothetical protein
MAGDAALFDLHWSRRNATETNNKLSVLGNSCERVLFSLHSPKVANNMRNYDHRRSEAVVVDVAGVPADRVQKPMYLTLSMVKPAGT